MEVVKVGNSSYQTKTKNGYYSRLVETVVEVESSGAALMGVLTILVGVICLL